MGRSVILGCCLNWADTLSWDKNNLKRKFFILEIELV
jgi:hypothetical protein